jgi:hypothetical protein
MRGARRFDFENLHIERGERKIQEFLQPTIHSIFASNVTVEQAANL